MWKSLAWTNLEVNVNTEPVEVWINLWINQVIVLISGKSKRIILKACFLSPEYPDGFAHCQRLGGLFYQQHA